MNIATLPANISTGNARLPASYEQAKTALANCASIDECKEWADKAEALASYARQADDDTLRKMADRIQARAVRRCGELLKTFSAGREQGGRPSENGMGTHTVSQRQAARDAGISRHQQVTAVRVANVPEPEFEQAVESDTPPTVTKLAEAGKKTREPPVDHLHGRDPQQFYAATHTLGAMRRFAEKCDEYAPEFVAGGVGSNEIQQARELVSRIDAWLDRFVVNLKG